MFFSSTQQQTSTSSTLSQNKKKQFDYMKSSARKDRSILIQNQRYLNSIDIIDWHLDFNRFTEKVKQTYNYYTLLNTLFLISQEANWKYYLPHMEMLVATFHNMSNEGTCANIQSISKISNFQLKFQKLFQLKDLSFHKHVLLLLKMIIAFNEKYNIISEQRVSQFLAEATTYNNIDVISQILWILSQIQVSEKALVRLFKLKNLQEAIEKSIVCLLPFLTILGNFLHKKDHNMNVLIQLIESQLFQKAFSLGLSSGDRDIQNQTILIMNNGICYSKQIRQILLKGNQITITILSIDCEESRQFKEILAILGCPMVQNNFKFIQQTNMLRQFNQTFETMMQ